MGRGARYQRGAARSPEQFIADVDESNPESAFWDEPSGSSQPSAASSAPRSRRPASNASSAKSRGHSSAGQRSTLPSPKIARLQKARERFRAGVEAYLRSDYREARARFLDAYQLQPNPRLLYNIAMAELLLGRTAKACWRYQEFLAARGSSRSAPSAQGQLAKTCGVP